MKQRAIDYIKNKTANTKPAEIRTKVRPEIDLAKLLRQKRVYIMAACGKAMATIAALFKEIGFHVRGSDGKCFPPMRDIVMSATDEYYDGYNVSHLKSDELVVVGNAISCDNVEFRAVQEMKIPHVSVSEVIGEIFIGSGDHRKSLVVAGTHGKTTTTGLLAHVFESAGKNPGYMIGGVIVNNGKSFSAGIKPDSTYPDFSDYFISEGDEYNSALFDRGPKFLHYKPYATIITSVEYDHADLYPDMDDYKMAFELLVQEVPDSGLVIIDGDTQGTEYLKQKTSAKLITYGFGVHNNVRAENTSINLEKDCQEFDLVVNGVKMGRLETSLFGKYNISNILAVCALALREGLEISDIKSAIKTFRGMKRRQEIVLHQNLLQKNLTVIDDYAHHPTAVTLTLAGIRERYPSRRIIALFEPHSSTSRGRLFEKPYVDAFSPYSDVVMFHIPPMAPSADPEQFVRGSVINQYFIDSGKVQNNVHIYEGQSIDILFQELKSIVRDNDVIVMMTSGSFDGLVDKLQTL